MHSEKGKTLGKETRPVVIGSWSSREGLMTEAKHDGSFEATIKYHDFNGGHVTIYLGHNPQTCTPKSIQLILTINWYMLIEKN